MKLKEIIRLYQEYKCTKLEKHIVKEEQLMIYDLVKETRKNDCNCTKCAFTLICEQGCVPCETRLVK